MNSVPLCGRTRPSGLNSVPCESGQAVFCKTTRRSAEQRWTVSQPLRQRERVKLNHVGRCTDPAPGILCSPLKYVEEFEWHRCTWDEYRSRGAICPKDQGRPGQEEAFVSSLTLQIKTRDGFYVAISLSIAI